jgi:endonuclease YncB( thermonuclease family)
VERVVDGDTLAVRVTVWLGQELRVLVRVRGVDAPELRGACEAEKARARDAAAALARLVSGGSVVLTAIEGDKYYGRVLADVTTTEGNHVGLALISGGFVRPYDGGTRSGWCEIGATEPRGKVAGIVGKLRPR